MITCVVFMGGEWYPHELNAKLKIAIDCGLKTALYTGESDISQDIMKNLTFLKTGKWIEELGGLNSPRTNQRFLNVKTNKNLNHLFL